jgi:hypothetical protein
MRFRWNLHCKWGGECLSRVGKLELIILYRIVSIPSPEPVGRTKRPISQTPGEMRGLAERANYMLDIAESSLKDITHEGAQRAHDH